MIKIFSLILFLFNSGTSDRNVIEDYLNDELKNYSSFEYEIISKPQSANLDFQIDGTRKFKVKNHYAYIPVIVNSHGNSSRSYVTAKVKLFNKVFVAERRIAKGEELFPGDFSFSEMDVTSYREPVEFLTPDCEAKVSIAEGTLLEEWMIKKNPVVDQSAIVNAFAQYGSVAVEFKVKTRGEGAAGDIIRVVRDDKRMFTAEIIDSSTVKILE